jgi:hypothetical protein
MISDEDMIDAVREARGDNQMAFVKLERRFRNILNENLEGLHDQQGYEVWNSYYIEYMNHTLSTAKGLGIAVFNAWNLPSHEINRSVGDIYRDFTAAVDSFSMQVRLSNATHVALFTVHLTAEDKRKIHHFGSQIRDIVQKSNLALEKREELLSLLNTFLKEVDRDRTRMEYVGAFVTGVAHIIGESAKELDPLRAWIETIAKIFGKAQDSEPKRLPPSETKQIPAPDVPAPRPHARGSKPELDDDIPF